MSTERLARCGAGYNHDWHAFRDESGGRHVCDGQTRVTVACRCGLDRDPIPGARHIDNCPKRGAVIPSEVTP